MASSLIVSIEANWLICFANGISQIIFPQREVVMDGPLA